MKAYPLASGKHFVIHISHRSQGIVIPRSKLKHAREVIERYPPHRHGRRKLIISDLKKEGVLK